MAIGKFTLNWHSYNSHIKGVLGSLFHSGESSDVTLVSDDQVKFKAHKFVLKACSSVFESILDDTNDLKSIIYLKGVNKMELKPILEFVYTGQASFQQERMKEFLNVGKDLQIKTLKDISDEDKKPVIKENLKKIDYEDLVLEEATSSHINDTVNEEKFISSTNISETRKLDSSLSNSIQCSQCDAVFTERYSMLSHLRYKHEGVKYPCSQCNYKATTTSSLKRHVESVHTGTKYPCDHCEYRATSKPNLKSHVQKIHGLNIINLAHLMR